MTGPADVLEPGLRLDARGERLLAAYLAEVRAALGDDLERVVLFGSRARGDAAASSDWDLALFLRREPQDADRPRLCGIDRALGEAFDVGVQSRTFAPERWLATDELACNVRDEGIILFGSRERPVVERPHSAHARENSLGKARWFAVQAENARPDRFETVIHSGYYAMFHAARAALLASRGTASTNHGRVVEAFRRLATHRPEVRDHAEAMAAAQTLRLESDYGNTDLTDAARRVQAQLPPFLACCRRLVEKS